MLDQPLSLNQESLKKLFRSHISSGATFIRAHFDKNTEQELLIFLKNYFEHGLPIFSEDILDPETNQISYLNNPVNWVDKFTDAQIESALTYIYLSKYMDYHFINIIKSGPVEDALKSLLEEYNRKSIKNIQTVVHPKILKIESILKKNFPDKKFDYKYSEYIQNRDLNLLFNLCYDLSFKKRDPSPLENTYNNQRISDLIFEK